VDAGWAGYIAPDPSSPSLYQPPSVILCLRLLLSAAPATLLGLSLVAAFFYPLNKKKHEEVMARLRVIKGEVEVENEKVALL
jgi:GPH family glycoside/pentoside/hexuronide:cation symporter